MCNNLSAKISRDCDVAGNESPVVEKRSACLY